MGASIDEVATAASPKSLSPNLDPKIKYSIITIGRISNQLLNAEDSIKYIVSKKDDVFKIGGYNEEVYNLNTSLFALLNYSFIWYVAFLEEYNKHFTIKKHPAFRNDISAIKKNSSEFLKTINSIFINIEDARNYVLAHPYRKNGVPMTNQEINEQFYRLIQHPSIEAYTQLGNVVRLVFNEIQSRFGIVSEDDLSLTEPELNELD